MLLLMPFDTTLPPTGAAGSYSVTRARIWLDNAEGVSPAECAGVLLAMWKLCFQRADGAVAP